MQWHPLILSLQVASLATVVVLIVGLGLALLLARRRFPGHTVVDTVVNLPLVLPPSVLGFYLLFVLGRGSPVKEWLGIDILFTWMAAVVASATVALPLMVRTSKAAIESVDPNLEKAARTLGAPEWRVIKEVTLPLARRGIIAGLVLAFARALGEFGATLMVAGNIPGRTQTVPLAIYDLVQSNRVREANVLVLLMTAVSFAILWGVNRWQRSWWR
ncbi:MAG: molybdate ABC transporter permease subunit [Chloroflexi bacterium]|nr:molybdate ABC transporter permease subunit [Chloroflexota bacterium]